MSDVKTMFSLKKYYLVMFRQVAPNGTESIHYDMAGCHKSALPNEVKAVAVSLADQKYPETKSLVAVPANPLTAESIFHSNHPRNFEQEFLKCLQQKPDGIFSLTLSDVNESANESISAFSLIEFEETK